VSDLLEEHGERISRLKSSIDLPDGGITPDGIELDDVFFLRYVLSNKDKEDEKILEKIQFNLDYRMETDSPQSTWLMSLGKEMRSIHGSTYYPVGSPTNHHPLEAAISEHLFSAYTGDLRDGEPVSVVRVGISDLNTLISEHGKDAVTDFLVYEKEKVFRTCDARTRESGSIVKAVTVMDLSDLNPFGKRFSRDFITKCIAKSSSIASKLYPQMQVYTVVINASGSASMLYGLITSVMPKSSADKFIKCGVKGATESNNGALCPFLDMYDGLSAVPAFLGGTGEMPEGLLPPSERDGRVPMSKIKIKARSKRMIKIHIDEAGTEVKFESKVDGHHVIVSAEVISPTRENFNMQFNMPPTQLRDTNDLVSVTWTIPETGNLVVTFDNSFSKLTSKTVWYRITPTPPSANESKVVNYGFAGNLLSWEPTEANYNPFSGITSYSPCSIL